MKDPYVILGLPKTATRKQIEEAFRELARKYHPDLNKDPEAREKYKDVVWAYNQLKNDIQNTADSVFTSMSFSAGFESIPTKDILPSVSDLMNMVKEKLKIDLKENEVKFKCIVCGKEWTEKMFLNVDSVVEDICNACALRPFPKMLQKHF
ncbi:MAG: DnaJ domain-containing protein [Candidatus Bathyarchaeia archaeon]